MILLKYLKIQLGTDKSKNNFVGLLK